MGAASYDFGLGVRVSVGSSFPSHRHIWSIIGIFRPCCGCLRLEGFFCCNLALRVSIFFAESSNIPERDVAGLGFRIALSHSCSARMAERIDHKASLHLCFVVGLGSVFAYRSAVRYSRNLGTFVSKPDACLLCLSCAPMTALGPEAGVLGCGLCVAVVAYDHGCSTPLLASFRFRTLLVRPSSRWCIHGPSRIRSEWPVLNPNGASNIQIVVQGPDVMSHFFQSRIVLHGVLADWCFRYPPAERFLALQDFVSIGGSRSSCVRYPSLNSASQVGDLSGSLYVPFWCLISRRYGELLAELHNVVRVSWRRL